MKIGKGGHGSKKKLMNNKKWMRMVNLNINTLSSIFIELQHTCVPFVDGY